MSLPDEIIGQYIDAAVTNRSTADALLARHPELRSARRLGESLVRFLAVEDNAVGVRYLVSRGWPVDDRDEEGTTALIEAVRAGARNAVLALLELGADPNAQSRTYDNALHCAIECGDTQSVKLLLDHGADPNYRTETGDTAFDALPNKPAKQAAIRSLLVEHGGKEPKA